MGGLLGFDPGRVMRGGGIQGVILPLSPRLPLDVDKRNYP